MKGVSLAVTVIAGVLLVGDHVDAQALARRGAPAARRTGASRSSAMILGSAWMFDNTPIPHALVRLRNMTTGRIEATGIADGKGQFSFASVEGGFYAIELVNEGGAVLAISQTLQVGRGETVATFVRLAARGNWFGGLIGSAAAAAISSAATLGVTAVAPTGDPASPEVPPSGLR